ncbi:hypothetical protein [Nocardia sp. NPDC005978]|uniref:hypothetical protein n=1 Tax=unclassified Nocardia TaxID=2637762 RepID=UPI0033B5A422
MGSGNDEQHTEVRVVGFQLNTKNLTRAVVTSEGEGHRTVVRVPLLGLLRRILSAGPTE